MDEVTLRPGLEAALIRWGRVAVALVLLVTVLDWVGWATGTEVLTRFVPAWPQMTPWTALWLAALGAAILVLCCRPLPGRVWVGRGLAAAVCVTAVVIVAEYATGRSYGVDQLWFGDAVRELQSSWPGRPSPQTALSSLFLSAGVALPLTSRSWTRMVWAVCMITALVIPGVAVLSYLFDAIALVTVAESTGMAISTALGLLLLGAATLLLRPDRVPVVWLLSRPNRRTLIRLLGIIASFPILVGLSRRAFLALGLGQGEGLTLSTAVGTIIVGTTAFYYTQRVTALAQCLQQQTEQLTTELESAASYMASLMPHGLSGEVGVTSRYLPSRELGGDCFDYSWIDDDHLVVYLIDVSGHGIEPALLAVSLHNMLRSGSIAAETLLVPDAVLTELNQLFQMDQQNHHYFTMWYGVYQASTRTLCHASAGAPPALAFTATTGKAVTATELSTPSAPVGVFEETEFTSRAYRVPPGCRILLHSDGASELALADNQQLSLVDFKHVTTRLAGSPDWSLDELIEELRAMTPTGVFEDDCSMIQLRFD